MIENTWKQDAQELERSRGLSLSEDQMPSDMPTIAGYQIVEELGQGQYGSVWKAVDLNTRIPVAIKVFHQTGGLDYALLHGEVEKLRALGEDQRIVRLLEVGWDADPPYFVMDYLENSLDKRLLGGPLSIDDALPMFERIVAGLVHAHNKGVLHCDLKPGNILLDHDNQARIADFGQSRLSTQQTPALGTLFYMAPEQADLKGVPDARWDVYAAGAVLYCMLTGAAPHQTAEARKQLSEADTAPAVLARYREIIDDAPTPTEHHHVPGIDRGLVELIDRCLEKDPRRRYANAQAIREALHLRSRWLRQKPVLALGIMVPLVFLLLMAGAFWYQIRQVRGEAIEDMEAVARDSNRSFAAAVTGSVARQFDRRWRSLTSLAEKTDFRDALREWSREASALRTHSTDEPYPASVVQRPSTKRLQEWAERYLGAEYQGTRGIAWFVLDAEGYMAAFAAQRESAASFIGRNFKHRDYFKGVIENPAGPDVYVSRAFHPLEATGKAEPHHVLVFAVPIFDRDAVRGGPEPRAIGVLAMAVPVGDFFELQYPNLETSDSQARRDADDDWIPQIATLIDTRTIEAAKPDDAPGPPGLILHHAFYRLYGGDWYDDKYEEFPQELLSEGATNVLGKVVTGADEKSRQFDQQFKNAESLPNTKAVQVEKRRIAARRNAALAELYASMEGDLEKEFEDPFGYFDARFDPSGTQARATHAHPWILAARPVVVQRPGKSGLTMTGLVVLVQQRRDVVERSAHAMTGNMIHRAGMLFSVAGMLMLGVWSYGFSLLNPTSQSRLTRAIWRITGVRTARSARTGGTGAGTGVSARSGANAKSADSK
jgi:hypothetical protein